MAKTWTKDPNAKLDYQWDWTQWLPPEDTITSATVTIEDGLTQEGETIVASPKVTVWVSGGTEGSTYSMTCRVTTAGGRIDDRTVNINIKEQ